MSDHPATSSALNLYQTEDARTRFKDKLCIRQVERTVLEVP